MLIAGEAWLPQYREEIVRAKQRMAARKADGSYIPPRQYHGVRVHEKTVEEMRRNREDARKNAAEADKAKQRPAAK